MTTGRPRLRWRAPHIFTEDLIEQLRGANSARWGGHRWSEVVIGTCCSHPHFPSELAPDNYWFMWKIRVNWAKGLNFLHFWKATANIYLHLGILRVGWITHKTKWSFIQPSIPFHAVNWSIKVTFNLFQNVGFHEKDEPLAMMKSKYEDNMKTMNMMIMNLVSNERQQ